ncbi:hypothetical protein L210DRAFT_948076 [Boletus edulis BED1]|uniref:Uncharacterized protein n=1 Tax=Boletus edulis BED1 TaxID=1328754 RepID=A0AAD4C609_BOLED|nr:hypothetical protein L210DRAFT_948076 [Boletus edulis BED1]
MAICSDHRHPGPLAALQPSSLNSMGYLLFLFSQWVHFVLFCSSKELQGVGASVGRVSERVGRVCEWEGDGGAEEAER